MKQKINYCDNCGKEYDPKSRRVRFCCLECKEAYFKKVWKEFIKNNPNYKDGVTGE